MATKGQSTNPSTSSLTGFWTQSRQRYPIPISLGFVAVAFILMLSLNRGMLLFPLWSSIAFPMLTLSPFVVFSLPIPGKFKVFLSLLVVLVLIPFLGLSDTFFIELAIQIGIYAAMALGLNIVVGFAGLLDLGYIAFFAVGAYLWGVFASRQADTIFQINNALASPELFYVFLFGGVALAATFGILLGLPVLRLKGDYLAIVTLGFGEMIRILMSNLGSISSDPKYPVNITNGSQGLPGIASPPLPQFAFDAVAGLAKFMNIDVTNVSSLTYQLFFYFLVLLVGLIVALIAARLDDSPIGRAWTAIREDETAAIAMGVPLVRMKLLAFAMGASFAGAMGVIFAAKQTFVSPESFSFIQSIFILAIVIVGGMGSIQGVVLGAVVVTILNLQILKNLSLLINSLKTADNVAPFIQSIAQGWPPQLEPAKYERLIFGALLVVMMILRPTGIIPASRRKLEFQAAKDAELPPPEEPAPTQGAAGEKSNAA